MRKLVVDDPAAAAADRLGEAIEAGAHIALAGGSTPRAAYELLASRALEWSLCTLWFGDERCVPPDDQRSNYRMVREALLDPLADGAPRTNRIRGENGAEEAAELYERALRSELGGSGSGEMPTLDLVLLGIGPDGHTASIFPGKPALDERDRAVVGVLEAGLEPHVPRVTLTLAAINNAREVVFLAKGREKAGPVARAFGPDPDPSLPAALVRPSSGRLTLLLDPEAAADLPQQ